MRRIPFRPILIGILAGTALFMAPIAAIRIGLFILVVSALFRMGRRRRYQRWAAHWEAPDQGIIQLKRRDVSDISID